MKRALKDYLFLLGLVIFSPGDRLWAGDTPVFPQRIISLSPHYTEILYDIGVQDRLIGVTKFCKFPQEAQKKEVVGGFLNPDIEKIVALSPDLVLLLPASESTAETLKSLHIPILVHSNDRIEEVLETYDLLGEKLGCKMQAGRAKAKLVKRLEDIREKAKTRRAVSILFVVGHGVGSLQQIYTAGTNCFVGEILKWVGGNNVMAGTDIPFPLASKENLIKKNPEVIIDAIPSDEATKDTIEEAQRAWAMLPSLSAVKNNRLYFLKEDEYLIPGPTMVGLAEYLSEIFDGVDRKN